MLAVFKATRGILFVPTERLDHVVALVPHKNNLYFYNHYSPFPPLIPQYFELDLEESMSEDENGVFAVPLDFVVVDSLEPNNNRDLEMPERDELEEIVSREEDTSTLETDGESENEDFLENRYPVLVDPDDRGNQPGKIARLK